MSYKIILIILCISQNVYCSKSGEMHAVFMDTLKGNGKNVRVCLAIKDQGIAMSEREKKACEKTYRLYLSQLAAYYDFLEDLKNNK